jgi:large subunit ribosomal protein L21
MRYAVIRTGGKQYRVAPGDVIHVEKLPGGVGMPVEFGEVLLAADEGDVHVGQPLVGGSRVLGEIVAQGKAKKVLVFKKKRRKGYRRRQGHRQQVTSVKVTGIETAEEDHGTQERAREQP